jgi:hypothetical protein
MLNEHDDGSITLSKDRADVCLESAWELESLGFLLRKLGPDGDGVVTALQTRALSIRIVDLAGVVISSIHDTVSETGDLRKTVCPWET